MRINIREISLSLTFAATATLALGQVTTGQYPYGTFDSPGVDTINVGNLNVHLTIPVLNKPGRGLPFQANLAYDSSVYYPAPVGSSKTWTPTLQFPGWMNETGLIFGSFSYSSIGTQTESYVAYQENGQYVNIPVFCYYTEYTSWVFTDTKGAQHPFSGYTLQYNGQSSSPVPFTCGSDSPGGSGSAIDGSGYQLTLSNYTTASVSQVTGTTTVSSNGTSSTMTDSNGNQISTDGQGNFTDTTGKVVLKVTGNTTTSQVYTYYDTGGNPRSVTVSYSQYTVKTSFGCSGIGEYGPLTKYLVSSITLADSSAYHFSYETTPGSSGDYTGRIASIQLPAGGSINYTYTGGNNGIECADGSAAGLTRTIAAVSGSDSSTRTYTRTIPSSTTSQTTLVDGLGNSKVYSFVEPSNISSGMTALYYETSVSIYQQGNSTAVDAFKVCYNGSASTCSSSAPSLPFSWVDTYETLDGLKTKDTSVQFLGGFVGALNSLTYSDFGPNNTPAPSLLISNTIYTSTTPYVPSRQNIEDGNQDLVGETTYTYDGSSPTASSSVPQHISVSGPRRNLTALSQFSSATNPNTITMTYEDTGSVLTSTTPNPSCTSGPSCTFTFSYDPTFVYNTGTQLPTPSSGVALQISASYDTTYTGSVLQTTDVNGQQTVYPANKYDSMLRPTETDFPDSGKTTASFSPTEVSQSSYQSAGSFGQTVTLYDAYGRPNRTAVADGVNGSGPWYTRDSCYDANGNVKFTSYPYSSPSVTGAEVCSGTGGDAFTYDVLGRVTRIARGNGEVITYTYFGRSTKSVDENGVTRISQIDGLGRPTIICEVSSNSSMPGSGSPTSCGTDIAGTGFVTTYGYSYSTALNGSFLPVTTVTQGGQSRVFTTDWLGRLLSLQEPESGTTTYAYTYNVTGGVVTRQTPKANQSSATVLTTRTTQYDIMNRIVSVSYNDGITPGKAFQYDTNAGWVWSDFTPANLKGRMYLAYNSTAPAATTFSYDSMGRVKGMAVCLPSGCGNSTYDKFISLSYDEAGDLLSSTDGGGVTTSYTVSPASEVLTMTSSLSNTTNPPNILSNVVNGPNGPSSWSLGNGLSGAYSYDSLGRLKSGTISTAVPSQVYAFTATWKGSQLQNSSDSVLGQTSNYGYDEFNRLKSRTVTSGTVQNLNWVYDRWGNRWQQNVTAGSGPQPQFSVNTVNNHISGYSYDAAGNQTNDGTYNYTYDAEGNITAVNNGSTASYLYDALNHRVRTTVGSTVTEYVFNASEQRISEWNASTHSQLKGHYYWGSKPVAYYTTAAGGGAAAHFEHQDWLGTERIRTTYNASVEGTYASLPWGDNQTTTSGTDGDANHFAMLDFDSETQTNHAEFRQYSSAEGRWLRPDPSSASYNLGNPQSMNRYTYAMNNPVSDIDPAGLDACVHIGGDGSVFIYNAEDGGSVNCPTSDGWSTVTSNQQVTGVGFDSNGTLIAGTSSGLINQNGSAYSAPQTEWVFPDGTSNYVPTVISSPSIQYVYQVAPNNGSQPFTSATDEEKLAALQSIANAFPNWLTAKYFPDKFCNGVKGVGAVSTVVVVGAPATAPVVGPVASASGILSIAGCKW